MIKSSKAKTNIDNIFRLENTAMLDDTYATFRHNLLIRIMSIAATLTFLFATLDVLGLHEVGPAMRNFNFSFSALNAIIAVLLQKRIIKYLPACCLFLLLCYLGSISAVVNVPADEFRAIWFFLTIFFAYMLLSVSGGYIATLAAIIALFVMQFNVEGAYTDVSFNSIIIALIFFSLSLSSFAKQMEKFRLQINKQNQELYYLANKDPLTDTLNSNNYYNTTKSLLTKAKEENSELSMLCVYIDNLSTIYQKHGTHIETALLTHVEQLIRAKLQSKGTIAKISQQEYCVLLPEWNILSAKSLAKKINESAQEKLFSIGKSKVTITLSIGISTLLESDNEIRSIQVRADKALNRAKLNGGNEIHTN